MRTRLFPVLTCMVLVFALGCADRETKMADRQVELMDRVTQYNECFFWRDFNKASLFVVPEMKPDFLSYSEGLRRGFTLEDFTVKEVQMNPTGERAAVVIRRSFIMPPSVTLQSKEFTQDWTLREGVWYIAGPPY